MGCIDSLGSGINPSPKTESDKHVSITILTSLSVVLNVFLNDDFDGIRGIAMISSSVVAYLHVPLTSHRKSV